MSWGPPMRGDPARPAPGTRLATTGRVPVETTADETDYRRPFTRTFERTWDVSGLYAPTVAAAPLNAWYRGQIVRGARPALRLTWFGPMWDPTNPATWRAEL